MIEDTKWVKSITKNKPPKKGTVIIWHDDKRDMLFAPEMVTVCERALSEEFAVTYQKEKQGDYWNIVSLEMTSDRIDQLEPQKPQEQPPHPDEPTPEQLKPVAPPNPQAVGMITKEIGDMIRAGLLSKIFGVNIANNLIVWYRSQTLGITRINFDGKDLPKFE